MVAKINGLTTWPGDRDDIGHRSYHVEWEIMADIADGPFTIMNTPGLAAIGSPYVLGNDNDPWAFCHPEITVTPTVTKEPNRFWTATQLFTTKPLRRCGILPVESPLLEPLDITGNFLKYTEEALFDADGNQIMSTSFEPLRGSQVERDFNRPTVTITKNYAMLDLLTISQCLDTVHNAGILWGMPVGTIKFSNCSFTRLMYSLCTFYFRVTLEFEARYVFNALTGLFEGWERNIPDVGTRVLAKGGNPVNPQHWQRAKDPNDENFGVVALDGLGHIAPNNDPSDVPGAGKYYFPGVNIYPQGNLLLLGIPVTLYTAL